MCMKKIFHVSIISKLKSVLFKIREQDTFFEQKILWYGFCSLILHRSKIREPQLKIEQYD